MDLVLEVLDTYIFDGLYARILPQNGANGLAKGHYHYLTGGAIQQNTTGVAPPNGFDTYGQPFLLDPSKYAEASILKRDSIIRQFISFYLVAWLFGYLLYIVTATLSYFFVYHPDNLKHPRFLKNQIRQELTQSLKAIPMMAFMTAPWFVLEVRGYSKMYWDPHKHGIWYLLFQFPLFIMFTDAFIYLIHRGLHHPMVYKRLHKPHHKWIVPTPFASHAFNPIDGYFQSLPYHWFPFVFPLHKFSYILLFTFINIWTVLIHDGAYVTNHPVINGSACHTLHHLYFNYNYGQFTTLWDRLGGSHKRPGDELFDNANRLDKNSINKQTQEVDNTLKEVEHGDDREYFIEEKKVR